MTRLLSVDALRGFTVAAMVLVNNPGTWLFHCHNLVHMGGGLMAEVRYR